MNKVLIRPLVLNDSYISWKWRNDPEVWKYTRKKPDIVITEEIEKEWLLNKLGETNSFRFAIEVDDVYIGNIQLTDVIEHEKAEYHIFIGDKSYWGKGVASLATSQIIRFARVVLKLKYLYLNVNPENTGAIKIYEKAGFRKLNNNIEMKLNLEYTKPPMVSVFSMVYNHANFISDAIEGFLMQKTNFDFEIVIGEDCSTDNSRQIILEYQKKYPGKFQLLLHEKNIGAAANQMAVLEACTGKYIAICEGDDYWTDPYKLQKQVDFLEENPDCSLCFHASRNIRNNYLNNFTIHRPKQIPNDCKFEMKHAILGGGGFMATNSMVFLREHTNNRPEWMDRTPVSDSPLMLLLASKGKMAYIDEVMSVYRIMSSSTSWSAKMKNHSHRKMHYYAILRMWNDFDKWTEKKYHKYVTRKKIKNRWSYLKGNIFRLTEIFNSTKIQQMI